MPESTQLVGFIDERQVRAEKLLRSTNQMRRAIVRSGKSGSSSARSKNQTNCDDSFGEEVRRAEISMSTN